MKKEEIHIRVAALEDAEEILSIYTPYILDTAITFEYEIPSVEEFRERIRSTLSRYPYFVAVKDDNIIGYAYASALKGRKAYDWSIETSIYLKQDCRGLGVGRQLYEKLEQTLKIQGVRNVNACIAYTEEEDSYLTNDSMYFHEHLGYQLIGTFHKCAYKFDKWYDMIWMEKMIAEHDEKPEELIPFPEIIQERKYDV